MGKREGRVGVEEGRGNVVGGEGGRRGKRNKRVEVSDARRGEGGREGGRR